MKNNKRERLRDRLKAELLRIAAHTNSRHVHIGSCLSCFDILFYTLVYQMREKDKFILSKGHAALALYVVLNFQGKISAKTLNSYLEDGSKLGVHPPSCFPQEIPLATGSLGHGLSFACGLAKSFILQRKQSPSRVYCLLSDGECNEGSTWEAALFASQHKLANLIVIIDKNDFQAFGKTKEVLGDVASVDKWGAFGFQVFKCAGHQLSEFKKVFLKIKNSDKSRPKVVICQTLRGKGIKSLEGKLDSNYQAVSKQWLEEFQDAK